jgi:hypothetical protein
METTAVRQQVAVATSAEASAGYQLKSVPSLSKAQKAIHSQLMNQGDVALFAKKAVSMNDLRAIGQVTGDEYSMYTQGARRLIIRGFGNEVRVADEEMAAALRSGKFGKWSGHTHPPGYSSTPGQADRPNIPDGQSRSGIWADDGAGPFHRMPHEDQVFQEEKRRQIFQELYGHE